MPIFSIPHCAAWGRKLAIGGLLAISLFTIETSVTAQTLKSPQTASDRLFYEEDTGKKQEADKRRAMLRLDDDVAKERQQDDEDREDGKDGQEAPSEADEPLYEDFSKYIFDTTGKTVTDALPIKRSYIKSPKLSESYQLGSGDRVEIQVWGSISAQYRLTLDQTGRIFVPDVGNIPLAGVKVSELTSIVTGHFNRIYKGFQLRATVDTARSTSIQVLGQARSVGVKNVPATHTLLSATLSFAAPSPGGSRRFVEFQRSGKSLQKIDLYCFFRANCASIPEVLQDGDTIKVPSRGKLVAISGAVARPGIYELAEGESIKDLLSYAGGLSVIADPGRINLYSFGSGNRQERVLHSASIDQFCDRDSRAPDTQCADTLADGDYLDLQPKLTRVHNAVTVVAPGVDPIKMAFKPGMRLLDVLRAPFDALIPNRTLQAINGGSFANLNELDEKFRGLDLDALMIYRLDAERGEFQSVMASYRKALADAKGPANNNLQEGDVIVIENNSEWRSRRGNVSMSVRLMGEVRQPGRYRVTGMKTLGDVLDLAGGVTPNAALWSAVVLRQGDARNAVSRVVLDQALKSLTDYQARQELANSDGKAMPIAPMRQTGEQTLRDNLAGRQNGAELLDLMRGRSMVYLSTEDGYLAADLILEPYDIVIIPSAPDTFSCQGAFFRVGEMLISKQSASVDEATSRCGVLEEMHPNIYHFVARENRVCRADGWWNSCPKVRAGDLLVAVPEAVRRQGNAGEWLDTALKTLTAIATLKVLAD